MTLCRKSASAKDCGLNGLQIVPPVGIRIGVSLQVNFLKSVFPSINIGLIYCY